MGMITLLSQGGAGKPVACEEMGSGRGLRHPPLPQGGVLMSSALWPSGPLPLRAQKECRGRAHRDTKAFAQMEESLGLRGSPRGTRHSPNSQGSKCSASCLPSSQPGSLYPENHLCRDEVKNTPDTATEAAPVPLAHTAPRCSPNLHVDPRLPYHGQAPRPPVHTSPVTRLSPAPNDNSPVASIPRHTQSPHTSRWKNCPPLTHHPDKSPWTLTCMVSNTQAYS